MLSYEDIYDRWERSKSFGDPRDINQFSREMNQVTGTNDFDLGASAGGWTKFSHAANREFFHPLARGLGLEAAGQAVGGLFGERGRQIGGEIGLVAPRMIAQTIPLVAGEIASGGLATPILAPLGIAATAGLFGAETYAETQSPTAAAISTAAAGALPYAGKFGGQLGVKAFGPEVAEGVSKVGQRFVKSTLPVEEGLGPALRYKAAQLGGSQAAMFGTLEASGYAQAKALGQPFDPLSPEMIAQQIPFTLLDIGRAAMTKLPTAAQGHVAPVMPKAKQEYIPPPGEPAETANLAEMLDRVTGIAKDQNLTPEQKSKAFTDTLQTVIDPLKAAKPKQTDQVILIGHVKPVAGVDNVKMFVQQQKYFDELPEHMNVWVNNFDPKTMKMMTNPDGSTTMIVPRKNVSSNVQYPLGPGDFPSLRQKGQVGLKPAPPVTGEGIAPETDILSLRQKFSEVTNNNQAMLAAVVAKEPKDPEMAVQHWQQAIEKMTPAHLKPGYVSPFDSGESQVMKENEIPPEFLEPTTPAERTLYHGTQIPVRKFVADRPVYLTEDLKAAESYAVSSERAAEGARVPPREGEQVVQKFTPKFESTAEAEDVEQVMANMKVKDSIDDVLMGTSTQSQAVFEKLKSLGYDSIDYFDQHAVTGDVVPATIALKPEMLSPVEQIKIAAQKVEKTQMELSDARAKSDGIPTTVEEITDYIREPGEPEGLLAEDLNPRIRPGYGNPANLRAAARSPDGTMVEVTPGQGAVPSHIGSPEGWELGFVDPEGNFLNRLEAQEVSNQARTKLKLAEEQKAGATQAQATEKVRLQTQTPRVDKAKQENNIAKDDLRTASRGTGKANFLRDAKGKVIKTATPDAAEAALAEYQATNPGDPMRYRVVKNRGKYQIRTYPEEISLELGRKVEAEAVREAEAEEPEGAITGKGVYVPDLADEATKAEEGILHDPGEGSVQVVEPEVRPDLSFNDYVGQLDMATNNPTRVMKAGGFDDLPDTIQALRQFRVALTEPMREGKTDLKSINAALKKHGILTFDNETTMRETFKMVRDGLDDFQLRYRSKFLDSTIPHDPEVAAVTGIQAQNGLARFLEWYSGQKTGTIEGELAAALRKYSDFSHVDLEFSPEGSFYTNSRITKGRPKINLQRLPSSLDDATGDWGTRVLEEITHDTTDALHYRTDPAAVQFKASLTRIMRVVENSNNIPQAVRNLVKKSKAENWYQQWSDGKLDIHQAYLDAGGQEHWYNTFYSLQNEHELTAGIHGSPEFRELLTRTPMTNTPRTILQFFANVWAKAFGYSQRVENAFAQLLSSYDTYLSGPRMSRGYNGMSYLRDAALATGTHGRQLASRLEGLDKMYAHASFGPSIEAFEREMKEGILPATTVAGPINQALKEAMISGTAKDVKEVAETLLADVVPQHQELWLRMKDDHRITKTLHSESKKGHVPAEMTLFQEGLNSPEMAAKLNTLKAELDRHGAAIARWNTMDALTNSDGMHRLWSGSLKGEKVPNPTEQTGNEDIARMALNLEPKSNEYIAAERRRLAETGEKPLGPIERFAKFASFTERELPAFRPIYSTMLETQANAFRRMQEMNVVKNSDPQTKGLNKVVMKANKRVEETPGLNQIVSDMLRRANVMEKEKIPVTLGDPEMQEALRRASNAKRRDGRSDRDDVITAFNSEGSRFQYRVDRVIPEHFDMANRGLTALAIIGREIGMPSTKAVELADQFHNALKQLRDPAQQVQGAEGLRYLSTQMQPATFMKVMEQTNGFINDAERHTKFLQNNRYYTSEQRYGKFDLVMSREGEPFRESFMTEKAARARAEVLKKGGWILEDIVPKEAANVAGYLRAEDPLLASQRELDQQTLNRLESIISDLDPERQAMLRPMVQRAGEYEASAAAFSPVPTQASPRRKFRPGRETIDMLANANEETKRFVNWMRNRESRILSAVHMLDPEMLANRGLKQYATDFVNNQLAPDSAVARKINEATFYWYLAGNIGNDMLESMQSLTTGMASLISETGSYRDALKYITGASGQVFKRYTTGKWGNKETEWYINWLAARGHLGLPTWGDLQDPSTQSYFSVTGPKSDVGKALNAVKEGLRGYKSLFLRHNDMVGGLAGFQLGRDLGMALEDAARFGEGVKIRGLYTGGKVQRPVGMYNIKEKAVPQLMGALKTYVMGWFSQLAHNYKIGFANAPGDFTPAQRLGAKKAFMYMLGAQATLAGALGLPGVGQALALTKQITGLDLKGWTRKNLASMFNEDQDDYGGFMTGMALHGLLSQAAPFDISGRQVTDVPFTGVSSWKGFDMQNIVPVPFSMATDFLGGLGALARGQDPAKAFPIALRGPASLIYGAGDIRNSRGELLYNLSPTERFFKALGLEPSRVAAAKETAATVKSMNDAAEARKSAAVDKVADLYRRGDITGAQRRLADIQRENPTYDMANFVRSVASAVERRTFAYDWKREVNPALDIVGLANDQPSRELERRQLRQQVAGSLGVYERPNPRQNIRAASIDDLMNSDPYLTRSSALQRLLTARQLRRRNTFSLPEEYQ